MPVLAMKDPLSATFAALADPTRRAILARLAEGEATVTQLAQPFDVTLPAISQHLKVLENAGLVERSRRAQSRLSRLDLEPLRGAAEWIAHYRGLWEGRLNRLDQLLAELQSGGEAPAAGLERTSS